MDKEIVKVTERGWAGHYICADSCKFKRNTLLEYKDKKWVVSTVGALKDNFHSLNFEPKNGCQVIGLNRYYETMAFEAINDGFYYDINVGKPIDFESKGAIDDYNYNTDFEANEMHEMVVKELKEKIKE